jgi:hypothetical protein
MSAKILLLVVPRIPRLNKIHNYFISQTIKMNTDNLQNNFHFLPLGIAFILFLFGVVMLLFYDYLQSQILNYIF